MHAVHVEAVGLVVAVQHVDVEPLARLRVEDGAGNAAACLRFVDVGGDQRIGLGNRVVPIHILSVHQRVQRPPLHLGRGNRPRLVAVVPHAVERLSVMVVGVWRDGAVLPELLDLEVDMSNGRHGVVLLGETVGNMSRVWG